MYSLILWIKSKSENWVAGGDISSSSLPKSLEITEGFKNIRYIYRKRHTDLNEKKIP